MLRYNSTTLAPEAYSNGSWGAVPTTNGRVDFTNQNANISTTTLVKPTVDTVYMVSCIPVITTAAATSSTIPAVRFYWTDADSGWRGEHAEKRLSVRPQ